MPPTRSPRSSSLASLVDGFAASLTALLEKTSMERARNAVLSAFGGKVGGKVAGTFGGKIAGPVVWRGRPPGPAAAASNGSAAAAAPRKRRRKAPIQMCPVPGCKNRAAPIFGMVCSKHKGIAKGQIRKYREARRQKKLKAA